MTFFLWLKLSDMCIVSRAHLEAPVRGRVAIERDEETKDYIFYLLKIKHFLRDMEEFSLNKAEISKSDLMLFADKGMGNGRTDDINDIVWADPELLIKAKPKKWLMKFIHELFDKRDREKIYFDWPGRWGTRDKWLGIPISWSMCFSRKSDSGIPLKILGLMPLWGPHFFHNVTTMNIGYFSVRQDSGMVYRLEMAQGTTSTYNEKNILFILAYQLP
jgi:hypothetical protein